MDKGQRATAGLAAIAGNRATRKLLAPAERVQRAKSADERSVKHRRVARARATINLLAPAFDANLAAHLFRGAKADGSAADHDDPGGLHAYTNGQLPAGMVEVGTDGSTGQVHTLTWRWNDSVATKASTMFPRWMPTDHVKALVALKYRQYSAAGDVHPADTKTYVGKGQTFEIDRRVGGGGATVFPVR